jgi:hypothetical protein
MTSKSLTRAAETLEKDRVKIVAELSRIDQRIAALRDAATSLERAESVEKKPEPKMAVGKVTHPKARSRYGNVKESPFYRVANHLATRGNLTTHELHTLTGIPGNLVAATCQNLARKGFVEVAGKFRNPRNNRTSFVYAMTPKGRMYLAGVDTRKE